MTKPSLFFPSGPGAHLPRRAFLRYAGAASAGAALLLATGCKGGGDTSTPSAPTTSNGESVSLGSGDVAIINLLQAGKQVSVLLLERVAATLPEPAKRLVITMQGQQIIHREVLKAAANTSRAAASSAALSLRDLPADFNSLDLSTPTAALSAALGLFNTLVAGAAGAMRYTARGATLTLLGQVLSVDARHAATLAGLATAPSALDPSTTGPDARNRALTPAQTATALNALIQSGSRLLTASLP